jgi:phosphoribosyl 1,2-cyclic phosphodiesterase
MHLQVLSSGSGGNSTLVRAGDTALLIDAGLAGIEMEERLAAARLGHGGLDHVFVTHGHLDHARSAGLLARRHHATLHCSEAVMGNASIRRHKRLAALRIGSPCAAPNVHGDQGLRVTPVELPHDAPPTVAFKLEHEGRTAVILTDMGIPRSEVAKRLAGAHVLVLEFNHDNDMLEWGPYPPALKRRIAGNAGHLSNEQAAQMLRDLASEHLHTLVLAHLSAHNNSPELAREVAERTLAELGLCHVRVLIASQDQVGPSLEV